MIKKKLCSRLLISAMPMFFMVGCASYQNKVYKARNFIQEGQFELAVNDLKPLAEKQDGDQLVYLLDYAVALQMAGKIEESNAVFLKADRLADELDYHSVSRQAGSLLLNQEMVQYKGDTFEKVFINAYLAMNYLALGKLDDALVEARRLNEKYLKYRSDDKKAFELNVFGKYLSAIIWEASHSYDDAYIAYEESYKLDSSIPTLPADLIRTAKLARRNDAYKDWKSKFPQVIENPDWYKKQFGEIIVIFQQGWGPRKSYDQFNPRFPTLLSTYSGTVRSQLNLGENQEVLLSERIYDVDTAAKKTLQDDYAGLVGKRVAGIVAKEVVADQIRQKNELLGFFTAVALHASDRADLRSWSTLPQTIQIIRKPLAAGEYQYSLLGLNAGNEKTSDVLLNQKVTLSPGQKKFIIFRSVR